MIALIFGISGQDGGYLARHLLNNGYEVIGTSRESGAGQCLNLNKLSINNKVKMEKVQPEQFSQVEDIITKYMPDEIYNLSGQSSVGLSFQYPRETYDSIVLPTLNTLEVLKKLQVDIKFYNASSAECFGIQSLPINENTPMNPGSPYAVAKASAHLMVKNYRKVYDLYACNGILFNHESPMRSDNYVTLKIIRTAQRIALGSSEKLTLGNIDISRDWGWAPEYVEVMWKILQHETADDYVIATGETNTLSYFIDYTFKLLGLESKDHLEISKELYRPIDIKENFSDPIKSFDVLGWKAKFKLNDVIKEILKDKG